MRRMLIFIVTLFALTHPSRAQINSDRIGMGLDAFYRPAAEAYLFWEHEMSYHNAWEVFAAGTLKIGGDFSGLWNNYKFWGVGAAWKPCIWRARNRFGSARIGASLGAAPLDFLAGIHAGYQHNYALHGGWQFYWRAGIDVMLPKRNDLFRAGAGIGIKMPLPDRRIR